MPVSARIQIRCIARSRIIESTQQLGRITARLQILAGMPAPVLVTRTESIWYTGMIGKIERAIPTYLRTHRGDRSCIANIHRRLQERDISVQHTRPMSQFIAIPAGFCVCCKRFQSLGRRSVRGKRKRRRTRGEERFLARTRTPSTVWPIRSWARRADGHCLPAPYIISDKLGEQRRGIGNAVDKE